MASENIELLVENRTKGKGASRRLRMSRQTPGVVYGGALDESLHLQAEEKHIDKFARHAFENTIFRLKSSDKGLDGLFGLMKSCQRHPVSRRPLHFDFLSINMNEVVRVPVELKFVGKAIGVAEGGILQPLVRDIEVECLPSKIPHSVEIDVTNLNVHDTLHLSEIKLPEGVVSTTTEDLSLVTVSMIREEVEKPAETVVAGDAAAAATPAEDKKKSE